MGKTKDFIEPKGSRRRDGWVEGWADGWAEEWVDGWVEGEGKGGVWV